MKKTLSPAQKRVLIAKDTIKWLDAKAILAKRSGGYFKVTGQGIKIKSIDDELDTALKTKTCQVCAIGGMFYSMVRRFDNITVDIGYIVTSSKNKQYFTKVGKSNIFDELEKYFSLEQLELIESAFEMCDMFHDTVLDENEPGTSERARAINFAISDFKSPRARLRKIMNNIIQNNGVFKP